MNGFARAQGTACARHCTSGVLLLSRKDFIAPGGETGQPSGGVRRLKGAALGKFPAREITSAIEQTMWEFR